MSFISELKRRNVFRVGAAYLAGSWLLVQLVTTISPLFNIPESAARILVMCLTIGFFPALILAWVFELTPEGIQKEEAVDHSTATSRASTRRFDRIVIVVLTLAVVMFAVDRFVLEPARDARLEEEITEQVRLESAVQEIDTSIVVLPFSDLSAGNDQGYFSDGIAEELLNLLARLPDLRVIARTSAFAFRDSGATIREIADTLDVSHVLEGSVRQSDGRFRITAQLIETATESSLWTQTFEREMGDIFAIQDEIASEVVSRLQITLQGDFPEQYETSPELYELFLRAAHIARNLAGDNYPLAREYLEEVIAADPDFFPAWSLLWFFYDNLSLTGHISQQDSVDLLKGLLVEMEARWPEEAATNYNLAMMTLREDNDLPQAAVYMERSIAANSSGTNAGIINFLLAMNRPHEAIVYGNYCVRKNPLDMVCYINLMSAHFAASQFAEMAQVFSHASALDLAGSRNIRSLHGMGLLLNGDAKAALDIFITMGSAPPFENRRLSGMAMAYHDLGMEEEFLNTITDIRELFQDAVLWVAAVHAHTGDLDAAYEELMMWGDVIVSQFDPPIMHVMKQHSRWSELAEKAGIWPDDYRDDIPFDISPVLSR